MPSFWFPDAVTSMLRSFGGWGLRLYGATSGAIGIRPAANAGATDYTLPGSAPVADGQGLVSSAAGQLTWGGPFAALSGANFSGQVLFSRAGASATSPVTIRGEIYSGGSGSTTTPLTLWQPGSATNASTWNTGGTMLGLNSSAGFTGNFVDVHVNGGASVLTVDAAGSLTSANVIQCGGSSAFVMGNRSRISSPIDGTIRLTDSSQSFLNSVQFGGATSSYPALKVSGSGLQCRLADDSGDAAFQAATVVATGSSSSGSPAMSWTGSIFLGSTPHLLIQPAGTSPATWNAAGTCFGINTPSTSVIAFEVRSNGGTTAFSITPSGSVTTAGLFRATRSGSASTPILGATGSVYTGGDGTTTQPMFLFQTSTPSNVSTWSTNGTYLGINTNAGFSGNFLDFHINAGASVFAVSSTGSIVSASTISTADPTSGAGPAWKLGAKKSTTVTFDGGNYLEVNVAGTIYKLALAQ